MGGIFFAISDTLHRKRRCPVCGKEQIVSRERSRETVKCIKCESLVPPLNRNGRTRADSKRAYGVSMNGVEKQSVEVSGSKRTIRAIGTAALAAIVALIVWYGAMTIGYVLMVVALSVFFLIVAFDVGVPKQSSDFTGE